MNINDVENPDEIPEDVTKAIFDRQRELMEKYHHIEDRNGLLQTPDNPVDLHCRFGQARLKDFAWRMTEEFTEATDAHSDREHYLEELIDGLHFLVEMMIIADVYPQKAMSEYPPNLDADPYAVIERVGCACNCLKNKPWKQSHMLTDLEKFRGHMEEAWATFVAMMDNEHLDAADVYNLYFRKASVNSFRQRSQY